MLDGLECSESPIAVAPSSKVTSDWNHLTKSSANTLSPVAPHKMKSNVANLRKIA
jgi:hypothetical protein